MFKEFDIVMKSNREVGILISFEGELRYNSFDEYGLAEFNGLVEDYQKGFWFGPLRKIDSLGKYYEN